VLPQALAMVVPRHHEQLHLDLQGHLAGHHRQPVRADRRAGLALNSDANWRPFKIEGYIFQQVVRQQLPRAARHRPVVAKGERIVICGPSGSGKSTLIRCINRLEEHQQGRLIVDGMELTDDVKAIDEVRKKWAWCSSSSTCSRT
jgi:ABC-type bacteriocin/lantibiotic exporter with double-glycine peptidase domain